MLIPLNIVMTYPVRWTKYQTLRDFIQNFYDSVGYDAFHSRFQYSYQNNELRMWVDQVSFNYEWLLHIGASTKGATPNQAGYFGEGFKIASLCALRDYSWDITMESADWRIHVIRTQHQIDSQNLQMLAYDFINVERTNSSCLILKNISETDYLLFKTVIISFYYPENPLLGDLIWKDEKRAIYTRSKYPIPAIFPYVDDFGRKGVVIGTPIHEKGLIFTVGVRSLIILFTTSEDLKKLRIISGQNIPTFFVLKKYIQFISGIKELRQKAGSPINQLII